MFGRTPELGWLRAPRAALIRWSREDPGPTAHRDQAGLRAKLGPAPNYLPADLFPQERGRRVECGVRAYFAGCLSSRVATVRDRPTMIGIHPLVEEGGSRGA